MFTRQIAKSNLDGTLNNAESTYRINIRIKELEDRVDNLEKNQH